VGVLRTDRLGDAVLTLPLLRVLQEDPDVETVVLLTTRYTAPLFASHPWVDEVVVLPLQPRENPPLPVVVRVARLLQNARLDGVLLPFSKPGLALATRFAGIPVRVGPRRLYAYWTLTHRVPLPADAPLHEMERALRLYEVWRKRPVPNPPDPWIPVSPTMRSMAEELWKGTDSARRVVVHPRTGGTARSWPEDRCRELSQRLIREGFHVVWTGSGRDRREGIPLHRTPIRDLRGKLSLQELMALLAGARLVIAPATGPLHLAAALGTPVLGLYDPTHRHHVQRWAPRGAPHRILGMEVTRLEDLDLESVLETALDMLQAVGDP
jgi:ADP-heptose:LPS heptosyltransferase